jgi:uncharacterized membrane protein YfhO
MIQRHGQHGDQLQLVAGQVKAPACFHGHSPFRPILAPPPPTCQRRRQKFHFRNRRTLYENPLENVSFSRDGDSLTGSLETGQDGYLITSIPYDKSFRITVDGEEIKAEKVNTAFLGGKVPKGTHEIEISYQAPGKNPGFFLTGAGMIAFVCLKLKDRRRKRDEQVE